MENLIELNTNIKLKKSPSKGRKKKTSKLLKMKPQLIKLKTIKLVNIKPKTLKLFIKINKRRKKIYLRKFKRIKSKFFLNKFNRKKIKLPKLIFSNVQFKHLQK
jgi:hypothetical protein